jgi:hypothetical protein
MINSLSLLVISHLLNKPNGLNLIILKQVLYLIIQLVITAADGITLHYDKSIQHITYKLQDNKN